MVLTHPALSMNVLVDTWVGLQGKSFPIYWEINSHLILLFNTVSIQLIVTIKIDIKPHTILKYKSTDQSYKNVTTKKWNKLFLFLPNKMEDKPDGQ